jgi:hypothetical protein
VLRRALRFSRGWKPLAGAPGSRSQARGEIPVSRAGRQKPGGRRRPLHGEQARGPQHEVKPAASTEEQSESRAAHFTAKATSKAPVPERAVDLGGVEGAARVQGGVRNTRGPSLSPSSRHMTTARRLPSGRVVRRDHRQYYAPLGLPLCSARFRLWLIRAALHGRRVRSQPPRWASARRQSETTAESTVGRGQAIFGTSLPRAVRPHLQE